MDFDFKNIFKDVNKVLNSAKTNLTPEQQVQVNQFQNKTKNFFKGNDLSDVSKIDINSLNLRLEELKTLANGFADNK
jgi:hypothetical protein